MKQIPLEDDVLNFCEGIAKKLGYRVSAPIYNRYQETYGLIRKEQPTFSIEQLHQTTRTKIQEIYKWVKS